MERNNVYGWVNGNPVYSRNEFVFKCRGLEREITDDDELLKFAEKVTHNWYDAGWHHTFTSFYLSDYALSEPYRSMTLSEFNRLKELQNIARQKEKEADEAREWKYVETIYWADNSVEEVWEDKDGVRKNVMVTAPHGDAC